jgi:cyclohexyl-isocyanide hydratase
VKIAFVLFDRMNMLDFVGVYDALTRLKTLGLVDSFTCKTCALKEEIRDNHGLMLKPDVAHESLDGYDIVVVPGGAGARVLCHDEIFLAWIRSARFATMKAGVCTGALLLGAAGFLKGKAATTHPSAFDLLAPYCQDVIATRVVEAGDTFTCRGVSASLDLGIYLCQKVAGKDAAQKVAASMDYPFFDFGL